MVFYEFLWYIMNSKNRKEKDMESKPMKILIIEDDIDDCNRFVNCIKSREDIELVALTDSDVEGM